MIAGYRQQLAGSFEDQSLFPLAEFTEHTCTQSVHQRAKLAQSMLMTKFVHTSCRILGVREGPSLGGGGGGALNARLVEPFWTAGHLMHNFPAHELTSCTLSQEVFLKYSLLHLTKKPFSDSVIFVAKKRVENRLWAKSDFCAKTKALSHWQTNQMSTRGLHKTASENGKIQLDPDIQKSTLFISTRIRQSTKLEVLVTFD